MVQLPPNVVLRILELDGGLELAGPCLHAGPYGREEIVIEQGHGDTEGGGVRRGEECRQPGGKECGDDALHARVQSKREG